MDSRKLNGFNNGRDTTDGVGGQPPEQIQLPFTDEPVITFETAEEYFLNLESNRLEGYDFAKLKELCEADKQDAMLWSAFYRVSYSAEQKRRVWEISQLENELTLQEELQATINELQGKLIEYNVTNEENVKLKAQFETVKQSLQIMTNTISSLSDALVLANKK